MRKIAIVLLLAMAGCESPRTHMGQRVIDAPFPIAGGQTLMLPVTAGGTVPAENDKVKIQVAGFVTGPSKSIPQGRTLTWIFSFTLKTSQPVEQVTVEEVAPGDPAVLMVRDEAPKLDRNDWSGRTAAIEMSPQALPWLYSPSTSVFVYKFTIKIQGELAQVLYQPTGYSAAAKQMMTKQVAQPRSNSQ